MRDSHKQGLTFEIQLFSTPAKNIGAVLSQVTEIICEISSSPQRPTPTCSAAPGQAHFRPLGTGYCRGMLWCSSISLRGFYATGVLQWGLTVPASGTINQGFLVTNSQLSRLPNIKLHCIISNLAKKTQRI